MAIVLEEQKSRFPWFFFLILFLIVLILGIAGYFLFYVQPDLVGRVLPSSFTGVVDLSVSGADLSTLQRNPSFSNLREQVSPPVLNEGVFGKGNPFVR